LSAHARAPLSAWTRERIVKWALASPLPSFASLSPAVPLAELCPDGVHLMFEHFDVLASGGVLRGDGREGLTGLNRSVKAEVLVHLVFDLHGFAVLERDPVQPIAIGFITIPRDENWPSLTKVRLTPFSPSSCPLTWSALTARAKRSWPISDNYMAGDLSPGLDPSRRHVRSCQGICVHVLHAIHGHRQSGRPAQGFDLGPVSFQHAQFWG
jgi:hypothetical protein